jgi:hypothetical protein
VISADANVQLIARSLAQLGLFMLTSQSGLSEGHSGPGRVACCGIGSVFGVHLSLPFLLPKTKGFVTVSLKLENKE